MEKVVNDVPKDTEQQKPKKMKPKPIEFVQDLPKIMKRQVINMLPPCGRVAKKGIKGFRVGQPIMARHPELNAYRLAHITGDLSKFVYFQFKIF